jgi:hypothetical protein
MFPTLKNKKFGYCNKNEAAKLMSRDKDFLDPEVSASLTRYITKHIIEADHYYGGYMEDRSFVLKNSYLEPSKFLHLGMDFWVPAGTPVCVDTLCQIKQVYCDTPEVSGWGTRVILYADDDNYLIYGHLNPISWKVGDWLLPKEILGTIGDRHHNGGWSDHLHVQAVDRNYFDPNWWTNPDLLDGYGELSEKEFLEKQFPNPMKYLAL